MRADCGESDSVTMGSCMRNAKSGGRIRRTNGHLTAAANFLQTVLPTRRTGNALEGPGQIRRYPAAVKPARLRRRPLLAHVTLVDLPRIKRQMTSDGGETRRRIGVVPGDSGDRQGTGNV